MGVDVIGKGDRLLITRQNTAGTSNLGGTGTFVTLTSTAGAYTAWSQVVASTGSDVLVTAVAVLANAAAATGDFPILVGVGIGGAGSEVSVLEQPCATTIAAAVTTVNDVAPPVWIASGQRVSVRLYNNGSNGVAYKVALFTVPYANLAVS